MKKVVFTGGGTAGHVYPAVAVIEQLKKKIPALDILWVGQHHGIEKRIALGQGYRYASISAGKLRRYLSIQNFFDIFKIGLGIVQAFFVLTKERPHLVFSKGGFVSVPVVWAASLLRIPIYIHESDSDSGLANRLASRCAEKIFVPYEETIGTFSASLRDRIEVSGNPIREEFLNADAQRARDRYQLKNTDRLILVLGGSLGSAQVNMLVQAIVPELPADCFVLHQMGDQLYQESHNPRYITVPFINEGLPDCIAASTVVISRSGAGSVWELAMLKAASIFIPLGQRGDQVRNAALIEKRGGCISLPGAMATAINLKSHVLKILQDPQQQASMKEAMSRMIKIDASEYLAKKIAEKIL
ncbi:MAG: undecaprenyldiphospho-muramoylpentapeptide beta-N-acetylglucosaminyltransferase [Spirochaetia bacterium]